MEKMIEILQAEYEAILKSKGLTQNQLLYLIQLNTAITELTNLKMLEHLKK